MCVLETVGKGRGWEWVCIRGSRGLGVCIRDSRGVPSVAGN